MDDKQEVGGASVPCDQDSGHSLESMSHIGRFCRKGRGLSHRVLRGWDGEGYQRCWGL